MTNNSENRKHTVNYRKTDIDNQIYDWIEQKASNGVFRSQDIIKQILYEAMEREKREKSNSEKSK